MRLLIALLIIAAAAGLVSAATNRPLRGVARITIKLVAWGWFFLAGIGGLMLLIHEGPLPITNGWFAMFSGIAACPVVAPLLGKYVGIRISSGVQFLMALLIMIAGRIAVVVVLHRPFLPQGGG